tara:strand:- start:386 stop:1111 length:726 start_codon:yes stop_codon:yes gene_type:complete
MLNPFISFPSSFSPEDIDDLYLWYDFSGENSTITKDGSDRISKITNGEGSTNLDMLQSTGSKQPLWVSASLNGLDTADLAGGRIMQTDDSASNVPSVAQPTTYFFVTYVPASTGERWLWDRGTGWGTDYDNSRQNCTKSNNTTWSAGGATRTMADTGQWSYLTQVFDGSDGLLRENGLQNGSSMNTGTRKISAGTIGNFSSDDHQLQTWNEEVAEIIMYSRALSTSEIEQVEEYLADKWDL